MRTLRIRPSVIAKLALVATGGFIGTSIRYLVTPLGSNALIPISLLAVNLIGSLAISLIDLSLVRRLSSVRSLRLLLITGLLGGMTSYSAVMLAEVKDVVNHHLWLFLIVFLTFFLFGPLVSLFGILRRIAAADLEVDPEEESL